MSARILIIIVKGSLKPKINIKKSKEFIYLKFLSLPYVKSLQFSHNNIGRKQISNDKKNILIMVKKLGSKQHQMFGEVVLMGATTGKMVTLGKGMRRFHKRAYKNEGGKPH